MNRTDLLPYLKGDGRTYRMEVHVGYATLQDVQTQVRGNIFYQVKGHPNTFSPYEWEELGYDDYFIYRGMDSSPNPEEVYTVDTQGSKWIPRIMTKGDKFSVVNTIIFRYKDTGQNVPSKPPYTFKYSIEFYNHYNTYTFKNGKTLEDVVELRGYLENGVNFERYWYAKDYGLVAWDAPPHGYWSAYIQDMPNKTLEPIYTPTWTPLPFLKIEDTMTTAEQAAMNNVDYGIFKATGILSLRDGASLSASRVGQVPTTDTIGYVTKPEFYVEADGYKWAFISSKDGTLSGFCAVNWLAFTPDTAEETPVQYGYIDVGGTEIRLSLSDINTGIEILEALLTILKNHR